MVARQSEPRLSPNCHEVRSNKMASLVRIILREFSFLTGVYEVFDANYDRGEDPLGLKDCLRSTDEAENRNRAVVQKRSVV